MSWFKKAFGWTKWINPTVWVANNWWVNPKKPKAAAADLRGQYQPRSASYGQVLPTVYGTTLITAPAWCRGQVEVHGSIWRQHQLVLGLCQGPVAAVRALWLSDGTDSDMTKSARIEWARAQACGFTLQPGNLSGNTPTGPSILSDATNDLYGWQVPSGGATDPAALHLALSPSSVRSFLPTLAAVTTLRLANLQYYVTEQVQDSEGQWIWVTTIHRIDDGDYPVVSAAEKELVVTLPAPAYGLPQVALGIAFNITPWELAPVAGGFSYPGMAHLRANPVDLAALYKPLAETQSLTPTYMAEITSLCASAPDGLRAQAADVILDIIGPNYYAANLNSGIETEIGAGGTAASGYRTYCHAAGFYVAGALEEQASAADHIQGILDATNATAVCSEGKIKVFPLGDEPITANGYTYTPNTTPLYDLGASSMLAGEQSPMIQVRALGGDVINVVSVEYLNSQASGANYRRDVETAFDGADIARQAAIYGGTGKREGSVAVLHWISMPAHARTIAQLMLQRARAIRNLQEVRLGWRYALLEPMDLVTLTDANLGLNHAPVRCGAVEEYETGEIRLETMDWPLGLAGAAQYETSSSDAGRPPLTDDPGAALEPWVGVVPAYLSGTQESAIWVAATGPSESYGGCDVYLSTDGTAYDYRGTIAGRSCMGYLTSALASGASLDTTNILAVDVGESRGVLTGTSAAGRDALETLCMVDGELLAFGTAAAGTGSYRYSLTSLRRGAYETTIGAHAIRTKFVRIDQRVLRVAVPPTYFGITLYLKLVPFNLRGAGRPALADVAPWTVVLTASTALAPSACTLTVTDAPPAVVANQWRATADENLHRRWANVAWTPGSELADSFEVVLYTGTDPDAASAYVVQPVAVGSTITSAVLACSAGASALTVRAAVRARFANGRVSAWRQSATSGTIDAGTGAVDGTDAKVLTLQATSQVFRVTADGASSAPSSITLTAVPGGALAGTATWTVEPAGAATLTGSSANVRTLAFSDLLQQYATITASINDGPGTYSDKITIVKLVDGATGTGAITSLLTNESHTLSASPDGTVASYSSATTQAKVFLGATDDTAQWTLSTAPSTGVTATLDQTAKSVTVTGMTVDSGYVDITLTRSARSAGMGNLLGSSSAFDSTTAWGRSAAGTGVAPAVVANAVVAPDGSMTADRITLDRGSGSSMGDYSCIWHTILGGQTEGQLFSGSVWLRAETGQTAAVTIRMGGALLHLTLTDQWRRYTLSHTYSAGDLTPFGIWNQGTWAATTPSAFYAWGAQVETGAVVTAYAPMVETLTKRFSVSKSRAGAQGQDGADGTNGTNGLDALTSYLTNDAVALAADVAGALIGSSPYATTAMKVMRGITDESALWSFSASPASSSSSVTYTLTGTPTNTLNVTGMATTIDSHTITLTATRSGYPTLTRQFTIAKSKTGATGSTGSPGAASTSYWLACSPSAVQKTAAGAYVQTSITAQSYSATGTGSPAAYAGRFIIATSDGTTWTDRYTSAANESSRAYTLPAGVVAIRVRLYLAGGTTTLLDEQVIPVVADGATGDAGATGLNALTPVISNAAHTVPAATDGTVSSYTGSGTTIQVYEGSTALTFNGATVVAAGQFAIGTPAVSPAASITAGARSGAGTTTATVAQHSAMTQDVVTITYPITARRAGGVDVTLSLVQTVTKSKAGAAGASADWVKVQSDNQNAFLAGFSGRGAWLQTGWSHTSGSRGHTLIAFNPATSAVVSGPTTFDTWAVGTSGLVSALNAVPDGAMAVLYSTDSTQCDSGLRTALQSFGSGRSDTWAAGRYSHAFIGTRGMAVGQAYEAISAAPDATGVVTLQAYYGAGGVVRNGSAGTTGATGARGSMTFYVDISPYTTWADSGRSGDDAASAVASWGGAHTGDTLTQYNTSAGIAITRYWNGSAWVSPGAVIDGNLVVTGTISANKFTGDALQTANYAEDGIGNPTAGAKLDSYGTAIKVAKQNLFIGDRTFEGRFYRASFTVSGTASTLTMLFNATPWDANPDTNYIAFVSPASYVEGGTPLSAPCFVVKRFWKSNTSMQIEWLAAPGASNSITWDVMLLRP